MTTRKPFAASGSEAVNPPIPAPATKMVREAATSRSGGLVLHHAFRRPRLARREIGSVPKQRRAIRADDLVVVAEIEKHMRMIERRIGAHAHEFLRTDLDDAHAGIVVKMRNDMIGHGSYLVWQWMRTQPTRRGTHECRPPLLRGIADSQSPDCSLAHANSTQSCRRREALLSSGLLCPKNGTSFRSQRNTGFSR